MCIACARTVGARDEYEVGEARGEGVVGGEGLGVLLHHGVAAGLDGESGVGVGRERGAGPVGVLREHQLREAREHVEEGDRLHGLEMGEGVYEDVCEHVNVQGAFADI